MLFCEARNRGIEQYLRNNAKAKKGGKATEKLTTTKGQREKNFKETGCKSTWRSQKLEVEIQVQGPPRLLAQKDIWSNCHASSTMNNNDLKMATTLYSI